MSEIWCNIIKENTEEYLIQIRDNNNNIKDYLIDRKECPRSYTVLMALTAYLSKTPDLSTPLHIYVDDLFVYNILKTYLLYWKKNNWMTSRGTPVAYVDILDDLYNVIHPISYECHFQSF